MLIEKPAAVRTELGRARCKREANANAGIAKPNLPTIIANAVVRL
jgi:hypothetical protein